jgi:hypothetical protein
MVKDRVDKEADAMQEAADPAAMLVALEMTVDATVKKAGPTPDSR